MYHRAHSPSDETATNKIQRGGGKQQHVDILTLCGIAAIHGCQSPNNISFFLYKRTFLFLFVFYFRATHDREELNVLETPSPFHDKAFSRNARFLEK